MPQHQTKKSSTPVIGGSSMKRRSELVVREKYCNTLPDLPFDPKFMAYRFGSNRFVTYSTTSLERSHVYEVTEPDLDLGIDVELVIPNYYSAPPNASQHLDPKDERLLEDDSVLQKNQTKSMHHAKSASWLRRTEYISSEQTTRFQPRTIQKVEAKVGCSIKKSWKEEMHYMDRDSQISNIKKTFDDAMKPIEGHFAKKPNVVPLEVLPVFPDFQLWKHQFAQVIFASDPVPVGRSVPAQLEEMSQAMIRGVMDESDEQFVAYFLPSEETLTKRKRDLEIEQEYQEDEVYEYRMVSEYNWNVKSKATKGYEENYFFVIRDNGVFYNGLETRVRLSKRRTRGPNPQLNTKLCVKHVPLAAIDYRFQRKRERELESLQEEDEEEEIVEKSVKSYVQVEADKGPDDSSGGSNSEKSDSDQRKPEPKASKGIVSGESDKEHASSDSDKESRNGSDRDSESGSSSGSSG